MSSSLSFSSFSTTASTSGFELLKTLNPSTVSLSNDNITNANVSAKFSTFTFKKNTKIKYLNPLPFASASWQRPSPPPVQSFQFPPSSIPPPIYQFLSSPKLNMNKYLFFPFSDIRIQSQSIWESFLLFVKKNENHTSNLAKSPANFFRSKLMPENKKEAVFSMDKICQIWRRSRLRLVAGNGGCNRRRKRLLDRWWSKGFSEVLETYKIYGLTWFTSWCFFIFYFIF